jgi:hypothetical protein
MFTIDAVTNDTATYRQAFVIKHSDTDMLSVVTGPVVSISSKANQLKLENNKGSLYIDNSGDATFSGTVNANNFFRPTKAGLAFAENVVAPVDKDFSSTSQKVNLGAPTNKWKDGHFAGTVNSTRMTQGGSPVIDAKGLINTLSTLRNATKDETTLKGMRDALADAIGGLIENLEHEIAVTMEISK